MLIGVGYRAHPRRSALTQPSGDGASCHAGRFNPRGLPAFYTLRRIQTAWLDVQQAFPFKAQPLTLCAFDVDCDDGADLTSRAAFRVTPAALGCPWEDTAFRGAMPPSWGVTRGLPAQGIGSHHRG